jgi:signal transduction histidine kinase
VSVTAFATPFDVEGFHAKTVRMLTSLSFKVGLALFVVVAGALAIVYVAVIPRIEDQLVDAKLEDVQGSAPTVNRAIKRAGAGARGLAVENLSEAVNARVVVFHRLTDTTLLNVADSRGVISSDVADDPVAWAAVASGRASGRVTRNGAEFAEVATLIDADTIVLLSANLNDVLATVRTVRRSIIVAGIVSLFVSWIVGYLAAWAYTRRLRRLEVAAGRLAAGDFETPVRDRGRDEVGQLAQAFDAMRLQLAHLDRARREFIANASHELRTPLFSLGGFLELLGGDDLDPEVRRDFLGEMQGQIERLTRLATDLLDLSRLDAGQLEVERATFDLTAAARLVADEFRVLAEAEDRTLSVRGSAPVAALGDELRVQQIARALVENALRHTPPGTAVSVDVGTGDGRAFLTVRDEGPGVPPDDLEHLFERFYRAGGGQASGSGLGLAIASELAARMEGALEACSRPGETVFTLVLPLSEPETSRENAQLSSSTATLV